MRRGGRKKVSVLSDYRMVARWPNKVCTHGLLEFPLKIVRLVPGRCLYWCPSEPRLVVTQGMKRACTVIRRCHCTERIAICGCGHAAF